MFLEIHPFLDYPGTYRRIIVLVVSWILFIFVTSVLMSPLSFLIVLSLFSFFLSLAKGLSLLLIL